MAVPKRKTSPSRRGMRRSHDALSVAAQAQLAEELGYRVAVYAPRPALFGLSRQAFQLGHVEEGISAAVFTDLNAAREWLRTG